MSQSFVEIALLQIMIVLASILFCVAMFPRIRKSIVRLTQFKLRTLMIATGISSVVFAIFKANPQLVDCLVDLHRYGSFQAMLNAVIFTAFLFGGPLLGLVLFDNFRYERDLQRERRERLKQLPAKPYFRARSSQAKPVRQQWID